MMKMLTKKQGIARRNLVFWWFFASYFCLFFLFGIVLDEIHVYCLKDGVKKDNNNNSSSMKTDTTWLMRAYNNIWGINEPNVCVLYKL